MASLEELKEERLEKLKKLREAGIDPYPAKVRRDKSVDEVLDNFNSLSEKETFSIAGRIMVLRKHGGSIFADLEDGSGVIQIYLKKDELADSFDPFDETVDMGDFVSVTGRPFLTKKGEKTVLVSKWTMVSKSLLPLPEKFHGLQDKELRFRKRYLDLLLNPEERELFERRAKFWAITREFMNANGFLEVETPTLEITTGGAEANPFRTHHDDFDIDIYLRISIGELWQKRLMAAGFEKTFEIGRAYRNEGTDQDHTQEFSNMEFYWAYADFRDGMRLAREFYSKLAGDIYGKNKFETRGHKFDLAGDWPELDYKETVLDKTGIDIEKADEKEMEEKLKELGVEYDARSRERLIDSLMKYARRQISGPAFLINHPKAVSPLSKEDPENPGTVERFQIIIAGSEVGNGYSELNDPVDQRLRFEVQQKLRKAGDKEAMMPDWEFLEMLEHGMPPVCGFGFGERLFAFFEDRPLREVQLFPLMKPKEE